MVNLDGQTLVAGSRLITLLDSTATTIGVSLGSRGSDRAAVARSVVRGITHAAALRVLRQASCDM